MTTYDYGGMWDFLKAVHFPGQTAATELTKASRATQGCRLDDTQKMTVSMWVRVSSHLIDDAANAGTPWVPYTESLYPFSPDPAPEIFDRGVPVLEFGIEPAELNNIPL